MGADIRTEGHHAVIRGVQRLSGAPVRALDIRAGAAMVIAALVADGVTEISDLHHLDRGYERFEEKLTPWAPTCGGSSVPATDGAMVIEGPPPRPDLGDDTLGWRSADAVVTVQARDQGRPAGRLVLLGSPRVVLHRVPAHRADRGGRHHARRHELRLLECRRWRCERSAAGGDPGRQRRDRRPGLLVAVAHGIRTGSHRSGSAARRSGRATCWSRRDGSGDLPGTRPRRGADPVRADRGAVEPAHHHPGADRCPEPLQPPARSWRSSLAVVVAPITEELFFRGLLFRALRDRHGFWLGAAVSAVLFGFVH